MNDNYMHYDSNVMYIIENIIGPAEPGQDLMYEDLCNNFNSQITNHCICNEICDLQTCPCSQKSASSIYFYSMNQEKRPLMKECYFTFPVIECNDLCSCSNNCENRVVQRGPVQGLCVKKCQEEEKGMGLFTKNPIPRGTFVCEYAGEVITETQALRRHANNLKDRKINYIFCLKEYSNGNILQTFIDPSIFGNIGRYINHSCEPNCIVIPTRVNTPIPKLAIFSNQDITPDSEITFNYGSQNNTENACLEINTKKMCLCHSKNCKQLLPFTNY